MTNILGIILSFIIPFVVGYIFLFFLFPKNDIDNPLRIGLAYGLGMGMLTQWMLLLGILNIPFNSIVIGAPLILISLIGILLLNRKKVFLPIKNQITPIQSKKFDFILLIFSLYVIYFTFYVFWRSLHIPISAWDAIATVGFKAKVFFFDQHIYQINQLPHNSYPLHTPFTETWIAFNIGYWDDKLIKAVFPMTFLSYLMIHYSFLKEITCQRWAMFGNVFLVSANFVVHHATIGYRDFNILYYNSVTVMLLVLWYRKNNNAFLILASLFAGFVTFVKLEGTAYLGIHTLLVLLILFYKKESKISEKVGDFIKFVIPSFAICSIFHIFKFFTIPVVGKGSASQDFDLNHLMMEFTVEQLERIPVIFSRFLDNFFLSGNWGLAWFILILSLVNSKKYKNFVEIKIIFTALNLFLCLNFFAFFLTQHYVWIAESNTALSRSILHFFPFVIILIILINFQIRKQTNI